MKQRIRLVVIGVACFALGVVADRLYNRVRPEGPAPVTEEAGANPPAVIVDFRDEPLWAYGFDSPPQPGDKAAPQGAPSRALRPNQDADEQTKRRTVEGSSARYSLVDIRDGQNVIDWFPGDHPPMPDVVAHGPAALEERTRGCGSCHLPNGKGRPENAQPAGLPLVYFLRQIEDFRNGLRYSADPRKPNTNTMIELARAMTDAELLAAAQYFSSIPYTPWVRVVETDLVPTTRIVGNLFIATSQERIEPIAGRIIEVPEDDEQSELNRNPRSGFIAYVPVGSVAKGEALVRLGGMTIVDNAIVQGKTTACTACHGEDLMGLADVPPLAGRSPSYIGRQIFDIQQGTRNGAAAQLMKLVVARLTPDDVVAIAAYLASRPPAEPSAPDAPRSASRTPGSSQGG